MEPVIGRPPIHKAAKRLDLVALRRELDAGVSPDLLADPYNSGSLRLPLQDAIVWGSALSEKSIDQRLAFIDVLLEAGASVDATDNVGRTALHCAVSQTDRSRYPTNFELIVDRLLRAGADVNVIDEDGKSVLAMAASSGRSTVISKLLSAGAVDPKGFDEPLRQALIGRDCHPHPRNCAVLMRAGAVLRKEIYPEYYAWLEQSPYLRKIVEYPGGFRAYALAHRQRLTAIFLPKFPFLPAEIVSHIVSFGFNCGCYEFDAAAAIEPVAHRTRSKGG